MTSNSGTSFIDTGVDFPNLTFYKCCGSKYMTFESGSCIWPDLDQDQGLCYKQCCGSRTFAWIRIQQKVKEHINKTLNSGLFVLLDSSIE